jgi:hypothetical protein
MSVISISACTGGSIIEVNDSGDNLIQNNFYYLSFTGATAEGCYKMIDYTGTTPVDGIQYYSTPFNSCTDCNDATTWLVGWCVDNSVSYIVDFGVESSGITSSEIRYLTFTGSGAPSGCYTIEAKYTGATDDGVSTLSSIYVDCPTCLSAHPTPTPTPSPTVTPTASVTPTVTPTTSKTPTPTPSSTAGSTPTPTVTPTTTATPTCTVTGTANVTPSPTPSITATNTPTQTASATPTPTPSQFGVFSANTYYEWTNQMEGSFSGGTWDASLGNVPHPINSAMEGGARGIVIDMSAVALGGFDGLNN